jgi:hypothetical protein
VNKLPVVFLISCLCVLSTKPVAGEKKELPYASSSIDALRSNLLAHPKDIKLRCGLIKRIIEEDLTPYDDQEMIPEEIVSLIKKGCQLDLDRVIKTLIQNESLSQINFRPNFKESGIEALYQEFLSSARTRPTVYSFPKFGFSISAPGYYIKDPETESNIRGSQFDQKRNEWIIRLVDMTFEGGEPGSFYPVSITIYRSSAEDSQEIKIRDFKDDPIPPKIEPMIIENQKVQYLSWQTPGIEYGQEFNSSVEISTGTKIIVLSFSYGLSGYGAMERIEGYSTKPEKEQKTLFERELQKDRVPNEKLISEIIRSFKFIH